MVKKGENILDDIVYSFMDIFIFTSFFQGNFNEID